MDYTISFGENGRKLPMAKFSDISKEEADQLSRIKNEYETKYVAIRIEKKRKEIADLLSSAGISYNVKVLDSIMEKEQEEMKDLLNSIGISNNKKVFDSIMTKKRRNPRQAIANNFRNPKKREQTLNWQPAAPM